VACKVIRKKQGPAFLFQPAIIHVSVTVKGLLGYHVYESVYVISFTYKHTLARAHTHTVCFFILCKRIWINRVPGHDGPAGHHNPRANLSDR